MVLIICKRSCVQANNSNRLFQTTDRLLIGCVESVKSAALAKKVSDLSEYARRLEPIQHPKLKITSCTLTIGYD